MADSSAARRRNEEEEASAPELRAARAVAARSVGLDDVIHQKTRLAIVSALAVQDALSFNELKDLLELTDGNLSVHARKLEEAGYLDCRKSFLGRTPHTEYRLTSKGRAALDRYLAHMKALVEAAGE